MIRYSELLKDPRWQKKRLEILERDNWMCQACGDTKSTLHVHHKWYRNGLNPWDYKGSSLVTLCDYCHKTEHAIQSHSIETLSRAILSRGALSADLVDLAHNISDMSDEELSLLLTVAVE